MFASVVEQFVLEDLLKFLVWVHSFVLKPASMCGYTLFCLHRVTAHFQAQIEKLIENALHLSSRDRNL